MGNRGKEAARLGRKEVRKGERGKKGG